MRSPLLSPRWLGLHLAALLVALVCTAGAYWQGNRAFEPDRDVITNPVEDLADAVPVTDLGEPGTYLHPNLTANTAVRARGRFDADAQLLVPQRMDGTEGYAVVAPLVTEEGVALAVNRGWSAEGTEPPPSPEGEVTVTGWLQPPQDSSEGFVPMGESEAGTAERIAPSVLVGEWDYRLYAAYLTLPGSDPAAGGLTPMPPPEPPTEFSINWRSLSYSVQWAMFGASGVAFWIILMRRELAEARARNTGGASEESERDPDQPAGAGS
ncbi:SURF1-like protein [Nocardiopsis terrae]|uniref:SURF1-like protein n=1 Tax=Nocardiopsis terrae TaxID=372655 RepID=A0ABR9HA35_9ACTN|nr:SURF1 family protein [Nocardiopsis terrae]MBE1455868.1 cytochrome oxidase assembly protein ShyY1 [Nocardiopsis terrae]GHC98276.1 SURF1-like protein [Nocardiopsis terrae]